MRKLIDSFIVCFIMFLYSNASAQYPASFLNIHCEPNDAYLFPKLVEIVQLADSFGIPLNIQLTPQWGSKILEDPVKLDKIRQWQINGHEIGAHHHGIEAGSGWDGYTDHPPEAWTHPDKYKGTMVDFMNILDQVAGDSLILNGGFGDTYDWPKGLIFRTFGNAVENAISQPVYENNNGQDCHAISYCVAFTEKKVDSLITLHSSAGYDDIFGFNNHVFNFDFSQTYLRKWMQFIAGKNNKNIRQIMRERGLLTSVENPMNGEISTKGFKLYQNYPNPFNLSTTIRYTIPEEVQVKITVYNSIGEKVAILIDAMQEIGNHEIIWNAAMLPSGSYFIQLATDIFRQVQECLLLK
jgi:hypothetical protein